MLSDEQHQEYDTTGTGVSIQEFEGKILATRHMAMEEKDSHFRLSNKVISYLLQMKPDSWRMFESVAMELDVYPLELLRSQDGKFLEEFAKGKAAIPTEYRIVTVQASKFIRRHGMDKSNGYRDFTMSALSLFNETLSSVNFDERIPDQARISLSHPITDIEFMAKSKGGTRRIEHSSIKGSPTFKESSADPVWSCYEATFHLNEDLVFNMLFLHKMFTRIDKKTSSLISKGGSKLYSLLCMISGSRAPTNAAWKLSMTLEECNALTGTNYKTVTQYASNFKLPDELTKKTEFDVTFSKEEETRIGKLYTRLIVFFSKKTEKIELSGKPVRCKLKPRPRVVVGSDLEGQWARYNIAILMDFRERLKSAGYKLPGADLRRLNNYRKIIGEKPLKS
ncbi:hypothetical protein [Vibrio alfacsensis]|uniref:hypothetical protein n=1 Tax=Vibrio alfacsensis TaxID=1074311 RepID=UPI004067B77A